MFKVWLVKYEDLKKYWRLKWILIGKHSNNKLLHASKVLNSKTLFCCRYLQNKKGADKNTCVATMMTIFFVYCHQQSKEIMKVLVMLKMMKKQMFATNTFPLRLLCFLVVWNAFWKHDNSWTTFQTTSSNNNNWQILVHCHMTYLWHFLDKEVITIK